MVLSASPSRPRWLLVCLLLLTYGVPLALPFLYPYPSRLGQTAIGTESSQVAVAQFTSSLLATNPRPAHVPDSTIYISRPPPSYYYVRPHLILHRLTTLTLPFLFWYIYLLLPTFTRQSSLSKSLNEARLLKRCVCESGSVALLKSLQVLTLRPDLFQKVTSFLSVSGPRAAAWNDELSTISDSVPTTFRFNEALGIICADLGLTLDQATDVFDFGTGDDDCEASATIGQVYKGETERE